MAKQTINIGLSANDKSGDPLRIAFNKVNQNFTELYALTGGDSTALKELAQDYAADMFTTGTHSGISIVYDDVNNKLNLTVANQAWSQISGKPSIPTDVADLTDNTNLLGGGFGSVSYQGTWNAEATYNAGLDMVDYNQSFYLKRSIDGNSLDIPPLDINAWVKLGDATGDIRFDVNVMYAGADIMSATGFINLDNGSHTQATIGTNNNMPLVISTYESLWNGGFNWTFGTDGNLILPEGGVIKHSNGTTYSGSSEQFTGTVDQVSTRMSTAWPITAVGGDNLTVTGDARAERNSGFLFSIWIDNQAESFTFPAPDDVTYNSGTGETTFWWIDWYPDNSWTGQKLHFIKTLRAGVNGPQVIETLNLGTGLSAVKDGSVVTLVASDTIGSIVGKAIGNGVALDLTKLINKIEPIANGTGGWYTLADGTEGQIMHIVATGQVANDYTILQLNARFINGANNIGEGNRSWLLFQPGVGSGSAGSTIRTIVFTNGYWNIPTYNFD